MNKKKPKDVNKEADDKNKMADGIPCTEIAEYLQAMLFRLIYIAHSTGVFLAMCSIVSGRSTRYK